MPSSRLGGEAVLHGETYDDANAHARELEAAQGLCFVHPFNDPDVIAGQGTIGAELERQWPKVPDAVFAPVGGGGLICGIGSYLKHRYPGIKIIGVEPVESASMYESLRAGQLVTLDRVGTFADGVAVRRVGDETFRVASEVVDEIILVNTDEMCAAIKDIFEDVRVVVEPAGALAVAGMKRYARAPGGRGQTFIAVNSGANMNFGRLRHVTERAEIGEHREALLAVEIPERPGAFLTFCEALGDRNITEFNYRYAPGAKARIFVGVSLQRGAAEAAEITALLEAQGYPVLDLSGNELAKLHIRHLVGGQVPGLKNELLYRFEFPERPGALLDVPAGHRRSLEHQPVPLPQSRLGLRPRARRRAGAGSGSRPSSRSISRSSATRTSTRPRTPRIGCFCKPSERAGSRTRGPTGGRADLACRVGETGTRRGRLAPAQPRRPPPPLWRRGSPRTSKLFVK